MRGEIDLRVQIGTTFRTEKFIVSDHIDTDFLLGMDVIRSFEMMIDIPNNNVKIAGHDCRYSDKPISVSRRVKIKLCKTVTIPANCAKFVRGSFPVSHASSHDYEGIIEPFCNLSRKCNLLVTGTLSYSQGNKINVHCVNPTDNEVTIYKNQLIGFFNPANHPVSSEVRSLKQVTGKEDWFDASTDIPRLPTACTVEETIQNGKWKDVSDLIKQLKIDELDHVPDYHKQQLKDLVCEYSHVFARNPNDLGLASFYESQLHLKNDFVPKWVPSRPVGHKIRPFMDAEISALSKSGQISPCKYSLWNSAVFMVPKNSSASTSWRFVVDARSLNSQCVQDNYELPRITNIFDRLSEHKILSSLDFVSSFTQIGLEEKSRHLTAFTYDGKRYMFNRMIQGQSSSSAEFSRAMSLLFNKVPFKALVLYIDDLLVCSNTYPDHLKRLRFVFDRLTFANLKLSPKKSKLFQQEVKFLGLHISKDGISVDPDKVKAIKNLPPPTNVRQVQRFLGMAGFHRRFIRSFAEISAPLYALTGKQNSRNFHWSKSCQEAFDKIKKALSSAPVLSLPDVNDELNSYVVTLDASKRGLGAVLTQLDPRTRERKVISYFSKKVPKHLQKWGATRLEFLALHSAIMHWKLYLQGSHFTVLSDCKALLNLQTIFAKDNAYMQRRIADLSGYRFTIKHVSGTSEDIQIADYLSRYAHNISEQTVATQTDESSIKNLNPKTPNPKTPNPKKVRNIKTRARDLINSTLSNSSTSDDSSESSDNEGPSYDYIPKFTKILRVSEMTSEPDNSVITTDDIIQEYDNDMLLSEVIDWVSSGSKPDDLDLSKCHREISYYYRKFELLKFSKGLLRIKSFNNSNSSDFKWTTVIPHTLIKRAISSFHDHIGSCHPGVANTYDQLSQRFHFYKMKEEVKLYVSACVTCQRSKATNRPLKAPLKPLIYNSFNSCIQIDHLEPSKQRTSRGNVALLTIVDMYSSYLVCVPVRSTSTEHTIKAIMKHWISKYGVPNKIQSDQGSGFESKLFKEVCKIFGIHKARSTPWKSSTQGKVESCHRRINTCFRSVLCNKDYHKYDEYIEWIVFTLNCMRSNRTGFSPNFLVFGQEARTPRDLFIPDTRDHSPSDYSTAAYKMYCHVRDTTRFVREKVDRQIEYMSSNYDKNVRGPYFEVGMSCMLLVNVPNHKFSQKWTGPHTVLEKINDYNYVIEINGQRKVVSITKMKHYTANKYSNPHPKPSNPKPSNPKPSNPKRPPTPPSISFWTDDDDITSVPPYFTRSSARKSRTPVTADSGVNTESTNVSSLPTPRRNRSRTPSTPTTPTTPTNHPTSFPPL